VTWPELIERLRALGIDCEVLASQDGIERRYFQGSVDGRLVQVPVHPKEDTVSDYLLRHLRHRFHLTETHLPALAVTSTNGTC